MMPQAEVTLSIGFSTATHEDILDIDEDAYQACKSEEDRETLLNEYWQNWANNYIKGSINISK